MYPNISLRMVPNLYLLGLPKFLLSYLNIDNDSTKVISASMLNKVSDALIKNKISNTKYITITGDGVKNPSVIEIRIGTPLKDIMPLFKIIDNVIFIANGLMNGKVINVEDFIITSDIDSIFIMKSTLDVTPSKCINCGACIDACPMNLNPKLFKKKKYHELYHNECINCGICSYICPVSINFKEEIERDTYE
jgi:electron transport complex protein RnfC